MHNPSSCTSRCPSAFLSASLVPIVCTRHTQTDEKGNHYPVAFWSRVLTPSQRKSPTPRAQEAYASVSALRNGADHIGLQPICACTDHQCLRNWHTECVADPFGP